MRTENHCRLLPLSTPFLVLLIGFVLAGCATSNKLVRPAQYPSSAKDWHGIDSIEFLQELRLEDYARLMVEPLDITSTKLPPTQDNTYEPAATLLKRVDVIMLTELPRGIKGQLEVLPKKSDAASLEKTLLLRGKVEEIDPGSRALRYWVGFGAGSAFVKINGEILDAKNNQVFLRFEQRRVGSMGMFGGDYNAMLNDCVVEISRDFGRMLALFRTPPGK